MFEGAGAESTAKQNKKAGRKNDGELCGQNGIIKVTKLEDLKSKPDSC